MRSFWTMIAAALLLAAGYVVYSMTMATEEASKALAAQRVARLEADKAKAAAQAAEAAAKPAAGVESAPVAKPATGTGEVKPENGGAAPAKNDVPATPAVTTPVNPPEKVAVRVPSDDAFPSEKIAEKLTPVIVVAHSYKPDGSPLTKSMGFLIAADLAVVGREVLSDSANVRIGLATGELVDTIGYVADDATRGFAIVKLAVAVKTTVVARLASKALDAEEVVAVVGPLTTQGLRVAPIFGKGEADAKLGAMVVLSTPVLETPSGCAIVNLEGEVVGIVTGATTEVPSAGRAVAAGAIAGTPRTLATAYAKPKTPESTQAHEAKVEADAEAKLEKQADGSTLVDGKYTMKGEGTAASPYEVTWEMLVSAQDTYDPRKGQKKLPGRVTMLDGKYVRINGYVAFPLYVEQPKELLGMLNQWDGCCIGTPPTPYDAIEVRLGGPVAKDDKLATYGVIEGKFGVKPYLVGDWLVGLFVMDDAKMTTKQFGGFGS